MQFRAQYVFSMDRLVKIDICSFMKAQLDMVTDDDIRVKLN
jgi:hypothetical protein